MKISKPLAFIIILIGLLGCTKEPALKVYSLDTPTVTAVYGNRYKNKSIKVTYPQSLKDKVSQKMNFSYSSIDSGNYQNSEWSNNMRKLLQGTFVEVLDESKLFKVVLSDTSTVKEDYRLESTIFAFQHRVRGEHSNAVVSIQFNLINTETGNLVKSKRFSYSESTPTTDAKGYVSATNVAVSKLSSDLMDWLK
ncbi:MAG: ABC-type transport auxiliary lipoprotein family protein [Sulfurovum sp.]|jgi:cholesterol transport system auxiliary component|uniref:ABC-type transport auxiliary lipoprotein family protein n=1 Tax=Sulfurovum sp. TaxID=1969726 RepID=UPI003C77A7E1